MNQKPSPVLTFARVKACSSRAIRSMMILLAPFLAGTSTADAVGPCTGFAQENEVAMAAMMTGMKVRPTGDVDRDFVAMMVPHHQGAIDMAIAELRHGRSEQLRRIAQEIIVGQQQEIAAMRLAVGEPLPAAAAAPTQAAMCDIPMRHH